MSQLLQTTAPTGRAVRIVYDSFAGRFSDSPRALYEWLLPRVAAEHLWLADPAHQEGFPAGVRTVRHGSPAGVAALESADLVVGNTHIDLDWVKKPGATYLQTWHGTPLKTVHRDVAWAPPGVLDRLELDVARWDHLVSPNAASTPRLRSAFRWDGPVLELGYPRNDVLQAPRADHVRARTRAAYGLADGETVVLYAPTFRDRIRAEPGRAPFELSLDLPLLARRLGPGVRILTRVHYFMTERYQPQTLPSVVDVSRHPDIAELYTAADIMVTDYSSAMFDFAVTGKPLVLYPYDRETYRRDRGFYFDLEPVAPGPVVTTQGDLTDVLLDRRGLRQFYADRYAQFRSTFCELDDGHATERLGRFVEHLLSVQGSRVA